MIPSRFLLAVLVLLAAPALSVAFDCWDYAEPGWGDALPLAEGDPVAVAVAVDHVHVATREPASLQTVRLTGAGGPALVSVLALDAAPYDVHVLGDLLAVYVGGEPSLRLFSLTDPAAPSPVSGLTGAGNLVVRRDQLLYVSDGDGDVVIWDVTDPAAPAPAGQFTAGSYLYGLHLRPAHLVTAASNGLTVYDLADPLAPQPVGALAMPLPQASCIEGDVLYFARHGAVGSVDLSDPTAPVLLDTADADFNPAGLVWTAGSLVYLNNAGIDIFDAADPADLRYQWERPDLFLVRDVHQAAGALWVAHRTFEGVGMVQRWDPQAPLYPFVSITDLDWQAERVHVHGDTAVVAAGYGLIVLDIADPQAPQVLSQIQVSDNWWYDAMAVQWPWVVLVELQDDPFYVIDVSDPTAPVITDVEPFTGIVEGCLLHGDHFYIGTGTSGVVTYALEDGDLVLRGSDATGGSVCYGLAVAGDHLLARAADRLHVFDLADPGDPAPAAVVSVGAMPMAMEVFGSLLVGVGWAGQLWDVSDPLAPQHLADLPVGGVGAELLADVLYFADSSDGVHAVDVADPAAPVVLGTLPVDGWATDVAVAGDHLAVTVRSGGLAMAGLQCADVVPALVGAFTCEDRGDGVAVAWTVTGGAAPVLERTDAGGVVSVAAARLPDGRWEAFDPWLDGDPDARVYTLRLDGAAVAQQAVARTAPQVEALAVGMAPNPFNPSVTVSWAQPRSAPVTVTLHDAAGRRVRTLVEGEARTAGRHEAMWDGRDDRGGALPSGVYVARVRAGDRVSAAKALLVK